MRHQLVNRAVRCKTVKHGGNRRRVPLERLEEGGAHSESPPDLLALNAALDRLEADDSSVAEVVRLRYFSGLTLEQVADVVGVGRTTISQWWKYGRAVLIARTRMRERVSSPMERPVPIECEKLIFLAVVDFAEPERSTKLREQCHGNAQLELSVRRLLKINDAQATGAGQSVPSMAAQDLEPAA